MDHRHTEDFARRMEAAGLRAQALRNEAIDAFFASIARALRSLAARLAHRRGAHRQEA
jgi:hypothetical protein